MKFDVSRAESLSRELDDPQFVGPDGETRTADYLAGQLAKMGLDLERRDVAGSRFPQRVGPWVGWLGYGLMVTSMFGLIVQDNLFLVMGGLVLSFCSQRWAHGVVCNWIRPGRRWPPIEAAPVLIATLPGHRPSRVRVVFQSVISGLNADPFHFSFRGPSRKSAAFAVLVVIPFLLAWAVLVLRCGLLLRPGRLGLLKPYRILARYVAPALVVMLWAGILTCLSLMYLRASGMAGQHRPDRRGLAILLEMARTWPRTGRRSIEPVFVVAGGQPLDYAGSREIVRLLKSRWSSAPALLVLFFAPGAGDELWLGTNTPPPSKIDELARDAARSLWIPCRRDDPWTLLSLWPFEEWNRVISLSGSAPGAIEDGPVDSQSLHRAAQLAAEVALRWAKRQEDVGPESSG